MRSNDVIPGPEEKAMLDKICRVVSKVADRYHYGDVWVFGNYYVGIYDDDTDIQILIDNHQPHGDLYKFAYDCSKELGLGTVIEFLVPGTRRTDYIMRNSRKVHTLDPE